MITPAKPLGLLWVPGQPLTYPRQAAAWHAVSASTWHLIWAAPAAQQGASAAGCCTAAAAGSVYYSHACAQHTDRAVAAWGQPSSGCVVPCCCCLQRWQLRSHARHGDNAVAACGRPAVNVCSGIAPVQVWACTVANKVICILLVRGLAVV